MQCSAIGMKEVMRGFQDWHCAVVGSWRGGGNCWKLGFVQWLALGMKECLDFKLAFV